MIAHTHLHVSDYPRSKAFYTQILVTLGYRQTFEVGEAAAFYDGRNTDFFILKEPVVPTYIAFEAKSREEVEAFHREALAAGGTDNGLPGYRERYWEGYYAAFILDFDGHNIEAAYWDYEKAGEASGA